MRTLIAGLALAASAGLSLAQAATTEGEVRKVDAAQRKITLKHGEIKNLDMPPMSMAFAVRDPSVLAKLKPGDKVRFAADKIDGVYTVTAIELAR